MCRNGYVDRLDIEFIDRTGCNQQTTRGREMTADSQIKKLSPEMAQRIALRLKGGHGRGDVHRVLFLGVRLSRPPGICPGVAANFSRESGGVQEQAANGPPDLQRFLGRMPNRAMSDLPERAMRS